VGTAGGKIFATYTKDVLTKAYVYTTEGALENEVKLPDLGNASGFGGEKTDAAVYYTFSSFTFPPTIYRYDIASKQSALFRSSEIPGSARTRMRRNRYFYKSKDGDADSDVHRP
jgi:prolyl oligopeptidase